MVFNNLINKKQKSLIMKRKFKVAIVGNGKLAKALIIGFLLGGFQPSDIVVIRREDSKSDFTWFEDLGIFVSIDMQNIAHAPSTILAVLPEGAGNVLSRMSRVIASDGMYEIISFISGLTLEEIEKSNLLIPRYRLVRGTCNINVSFGTGVICLDKGCTLFGPIAGESIPCGAGGIPDLSKRNHKYISMLGTVLCGPADRMHFSTVSVGSAPALAYQRILTSYTARDLSYEDNTQSLHLWLTAMDLELERFSYKTVIDQRDQFASVFDYIKNQRSVLWSNAFQYSELAAKELSLLIVQSCVKSLLCLGPTICTTDIEKLIKRIATENGSTEKGLLKVGSFEDNSFEVLQSAFVGMLKRSSEFKFDVDASIKREMLFWG